MNSALPTFSYHPDSFETIISQLVPHLPHSLPLIRRLQFRTSSSSAHVFSTVAPYAPAIPPLPFAATYVDRLRAPETECWIFSTFEQPACSEDPAEARARVLSLLYAIATLDDNDVEKRTKGRSPLMVLGTLNKELITLLAGNDMDWMTPQKVLTRDLDPISSIPSIQRKERHGVLSEISILYNKWLIGPPPTDGSKKSEELPQGYVYSKPHISELGTVLSRSEIPRTAETLAKLGSVGIRFLGAAAAGDERPVKNLRDVNDKPLVAWAFLGADGSLTSLHVEVAHRRKGLAKACSARLFSLLAHESEGMGFRSEEGGAGLAHSDVAEDNFESEGVAKALGGRKGWRVRWVGVDLGRVKQALE